MDYNKPDPYRLFYFCVRMSRANLFVSETKYLEKPSFVQLEAQLQSISSIETFSSMKHLYSQKCKKDHLPKIRIRQRYFRTFFFVDTPTQLGIHAFHGINLMSHNITGNLQSRITLCNDYNSMTECYDKQSTLHLLQSRNDALIFMSLSRF